MENIIDKMKDNRFKMILKENSVYLTNYKRIIILEEDLVKIKTNNKIIEIKGNNIKAKRIDFCRGYNFPNYSTCK